MENGQHSQLGSVQFSVCWRTVNVHRSKGVLVREKE